MLLKVIDALGMAQTIIVHGQEAVVDHSGTLTVTGDSELLMDANATRSGWQMQNISGAVMWVNESGGSAVPATEGSWQVPVGGVFPPAGFPVTTGQIHISGTIGSQYTAREW